MQLYFVLDERGEPLQETDPEAWSRWFEHANRSVARTVVTREVTVLTTFKGVEEAPETGEMPPLFETRVFGGLLDGEEAQHRTRTEALAAHAGLVEWCRMGSSPDAGITESQIT